MTARVYVALLRGVNVGGANPISMTSLKASFERLGFQDVRSYINSGNVLFRAGDEDPAALERRIDGMLARAHALPVKAVVRSQPEMARVVRTIAAAWKPDPQWKCNVIFLRRHLDAKRVLAEATLDAQIERAAACPGALVWSARIKNLSRTAMMKFGRSPLYQEATVRNVATTSRILQLMREMQ
jgi:uncharacterized protein (DUF1697 family)